MASILVVEDDPDILDLLAAILRSAGHDVVEAASGIDAVDLLDGDRRFDLLLTDAVMPGLNGFDLAQMAKTRHHRLRVLYLTAHHQQAMAMCDAGPQYGKLLNKPIGAAELRKEVNGALFARVP